METIFQHIKKEYGVDVLKKIAEENPGVMSYHRTQLDIEVPVWMHCVVHECHHCGALFSAWHITVEDFGDGREQHPPAVTGRLNVNFCPICGKRW